MRNRAWLAPLVAGLALTACQHPKYAAYTSVHKDYRCGVPWGWTVITDGDGADFASATFLGPFDPAFYLGVPSLSVRWHAYNKPHRLPDGLLESYASVDDYIDKTLRQVYGPDATLLWPVRDLDLGGGRRAKSFVVLSPVRVPESRRWGVATDARTGHTVNVRQHAYAVFPVRAGFYVLVYPATREGFKLYEPQFNELVNTFSPVEAPFRGRSDSPYARL